jgi:hypothetical protein
METPPSTLSQHYSIKVEPYKSGRGLKRYPFLWIMTRTAKSQRWPTSNNSLTRNRQLNNVHLLLAPLSLRQHQPPPTGTTTITMWIKTCLKAITKFATVPNHAGASAIFKLFQARPALLETRIKRPAAAATITVSQDYTSTDSSTHAPPIAKPTKLQRL